MIGRTNSAAGSSEKHFSNIIVSTDYLMGEQVNCKCDDVEYDVTLVFDADGEAAFTVNDWGTYAITTDGRTKTVDVLAWYQEYTVEFLYNIDVNITVEGAKGDNITIKKADGTLVETLIFGSTDTTKQTTLSIGEDGEDFIFESSVAKDTTSGTSNYSKTIHITSDTSILDDIYVPLVPTLTSASGQVISEADRSDYPAWKAFDGDDTTFSASSTETLFRIGYRFNSPTCVKRVYVKYYETITCNATIQSSNNGTDWIDLTTFSIKGSGFADIDNNNDYLYYRWKCNYNDYSGNDNQDIYTLQFYSVTKGVKVMPDGAIYWYGNECEDVTGGYFYGGEEGTYYSTTSGVSKSKNANDITLNFTSSSYVRNVWYCSNNAISIDGYTKICTTYEKGVVSGGDGSLTVIGSTTKPNSSGNYNTNIAETYLNTAATKAIKSGNLRMTSGSGYVMFKGYAERPTSFTSKNYALWLE